MSEIKMAKRKTENTLSKLKVSVGIESSLAESINANQSLSKTIHQEVFRRFKELFETLGIPGIPSIQLVAYDDNRKLGRQFFTLSINGETCSYPDELPQLIYCYMINVPFDADKSLNQVIGWLGKMISEDGNENFLLLSEFIGMMCTEIPKYQPGILLGEQQVVTYRNSLKDIVKKLKINPDHLPNDDLIRKILTEVLNLRISIAEKEIVRVSLLIIDLSDDCRSYPETERDAQSLLWPYKRLDIWIQGDRVPEDIRVVKIEIIQ